MNDSPSAETEPSGGQYVVVARRYRPQAFDDLVGQGMVSQALSNAIETDRVGHAYLFTGARGVGKTSTARILSKALNCEKGPTPNPCHECDICQTIASGEDVDVLEIDGASNRGIDEIRQLRSNVNVRPSRSRYKVYIIDEVHMLTKEAFNALLKTLEEPPPHVKFIFCTTDPEKIPITVLSRCQRFDFSPVGTDQIVGRLQHIVESEGATADEEALRVLARKAAGSVRDSQSLLEQLMSFTSEHITLDAVHSMLGTAGTERLHGTLRTLAAKDAGGALAELDAAIRDGVDAGQLCEQLLGCVRDLLALSVGAGPELMLHCSVSEADSLAEIATAWGTPNLLAAAQILDQALGRMRMVMHSRVLLEMAVIRIAQLEDLEALSSVISQVQAGVSPAPKKKTEVARQPTADVTSKPGVQRSKANAPTPSERQPAVSEERSGTVSRIDGAHGMPAKHQPGLSAMPADQALSAGGTAIATAAGEGQVSEAPTARVATPTTSTPATKEAKDLASGGKHVSDGASKPSKSVEDAVETPKMASEPAQESGSSSTGAGAATDIWQRTIQQLEGLAADCASQFEHAANSAPNRLVITFPAGYTSSKAFCERPDKLLQIERIASEIAGKKLKLEFHVKPGERAAEAAQPRKAATARQRQREILQHPYVARALEVFEAEVTGVSAPKRNTV